MLIYLLILSPLLGAIINGFFGKHNSKLGAHFIACTAVLFSFAASVILSWQLWQSEQQSEIYRAYTWIQAGSLEIPFELVLDRLSALMLLIVTGIGSLIHIYAGGYMSHEKQTHRFFAYLNLFVFMMLLLVLGNNLLVMFVGWEGVGLCSYLLIGYWFHERANASAGMKAFLVNRIGDIGFLIAIFLTYKHFQTLSFSELRELTWAGLSSTQISVLGLITLCLFIGACGKSAQIPLYVWLPDAMAGPTPVSALIHAATMVTAGIYMMTRLNFFFYLAPETMLLIAGVGLATAIMAALIALVQNDIKKVLAYSTVSQLGYMVLACGVGAFDAAVFHLLTHACFKALLFLAAGSVIFGLHHQQDMRQMGGLIHKMPITHGLMLVGVLAIIGFPGLSGFFSKDEILWRAFIMPGYGPVLWVFAAIAAACTAFYMVRLLCLTFYGFQRGKEEAHETPAVMWAPLVVLAALSIGIGYLGMPAIIAELWGTHNFFAAYLAPMLELSPQAQSQGHWAFISEPHSHNVEWALMLTSTTIALFSAGLALKLYINGPAASLNKLSQRFRATYNLLLDKFRVDELYQQHIVAPLEGIAQFMYVIMDIGFINRGINALAQVCNSISGLASFSMSGHLQRYAMWMVLGLLAFCTMFLKV